MRASENILSADLGDPDLHALCLRWAQWHREHGLIVPPLPKNILARYQPAKVRAAPTIGLSPVLSMLNTAINAQDDSPTKTAFLLFYLVPARSVKESAAALEISRDGFYRRVRRFRRRAYRAALALDQSAETARIMQAERYQTASIS
jgi:hypothetical protein